MPEALRRLLQLRSQLAIAHDEEHEPIGPLSQAGGCLEEQRMLLDRCQAANGRYHDRLFRNLEGRPCLPAIVVCDSEEALEVEAKRNQTDLRFACDAIGVEQLLFHLRRDGDQGVRAPGEPALDGQKEPRARRSEVSLEHVTVIGVDQPCAGPWSSRAVIRKRRQPADRARLRHMSVDNLRLPSAEGPVNPPERTEIPKGRNRSDQIVDVGRFDASQRKDGGHVSFRLAKMPVNQAGVEAAGAQAVTEGNGLDGRATDIQSSDDSCNSVSRRQAKPAKVSDLMDRSAPQSRKRLRHARRVIELVFTFVTR